MNKVKSFYQKCRRVWHTLKKPTKKEFEKISKISAVGILILGLLGFVISLVMQIFA